MNFRDIIDKYYEASLESNHRIHRGICNKVIKKYPDLIDMIEETAIEIVNNSEGEILEIIENCEDVFELEKEITDYLLTEIVASYFTGFIWHYVVQNHKKISKMIDSGAFDNEKVLTEDDFIRYNIEVEKILFEEDIDCSEKIRRISEGYGIEFDGILESEGERLMRNEIVLSYAVSGEDFPDYIQDFLKRKKLDDLPKHKLITTARMNLIP
ncbi:hypothetical protein C4588_02395 [Candidatus Parcubacteria bacterium]|nr:MAG: hypothetical protein C4588_02395 [Candidatus Parcubacteria bacterium]